MSRNDSSTSKEVLSKMISDFNDPIPTLADLVKEGRIRNNLKQNELAAHTQIDPTEICRIESGKIKKPSRDVLEALAPYIGLPFSTLLLYAGYNGVDTEEIYYNKRGEKINCDNIIKGIYKVDSELLELLEYITDFSKSDVELIKKVIYLTNITSHISEDKKKKILLEMMNSIKVFATLQFELIEQLLA